MFEIFRRKPRKDVSIWPSSASKSLETVSLLFCTMAFPFSGWKHPDWECSEEDELVFKPACNAFQVKAYFGLFSKKCDDFLLSDLARQSFTETVKSTRRDFGDVLEYFLEAQDTMIACAAGNEGKNEDEYSALLITIAMGWLMLDARSKKQEGEVNLEDPRQEKRLSEFCKYLDHAKTQAVNFFEQMIDTIVDFDVENFKYFTFRKNHSVFEEVLRRRVDFPELFSHMPAIKSENF